MNGYQILGIQDHADQIQSFMLIRLDCPAKYIELTRFVSQYPEFLYSREIVSNVVIVEFAYAHVTRPGFRTNSKIAIRARTPRADQFS